MIVLNDHVEYAKLSADAYTDKGITRLPGGIELKMNTFFNKAVFSFRGTEPKSWPDIRADVRGWPKFTRKGIVHRGVYKRCKTIWRAIGGTVRMHKARQRRIVFTGHSLGAMTAEVLAEFFCDVPVEVYAFAPAPCMRLYGQSKVMYHEWYSNGDDPVPQFNFFGAYKHYGTHIHLGDKPQGVLLDKGIFDHPMAKYLSALE